MTTLQREFIGRLRENFAVPSKEAQVKAIAFGSRRGRAHGATCSAEVAASARKVESW